MKMDEWWMISPLEVWLLLDECAAATWGHHGSFKIRLEKKAQKLSNDHSKFEYSFFSLKFKSEIYKESTSIYSLRCWKLKAKTNQNSLQHKLEPALKKQSKEGVILSFTLAPPILLLHLSTNTPPQSS